MWKRGILLLLHVFSLLSSKATVEAVPLKDILAKAGKWPRSEMLSRQIKPTGKGTR